MASRVQGATKCLRSPILITQSTASRIDASARGRRIFSVRVRNIRESIQLFELATDSSQTQDTNLLEYEKALAAFEAEYFRCLLTVTGGNLTAASRLAELNPRSLYEKMERHGLRKEQFRQQR